MSTRVKTDTDDAARPAAGARKAVKAKGSRPPAKAGKKSTDEGDQPLPEARHEAYALALARGLSKRAARMEAGYSATTKKVARTAAVLRRTEWLRLHLKWGASRDLAPVIDEMRRVAAATTPGSAAAAREIRALLIEIARLKEKLPITADLRTPAHPLDVEISKDEWLRRFGARD